MPYPYTPPAGDGRMTFAPLPEGEYEVRIDHAVEQVSKSSSKPMMVLELSVSDGAHRGARLWYYIPYDDSAADRFRKVLRSIGVPDVCQDLTEELFEGEVGRVKVKHELYQGERKAKVHYWIEAEPVPDDDTPPPPSAEDEPGTVDDDGPLPF